MGCFASALDKKPTYWFILLTMRSGRQVLASELLNARATPLLRSVADMCLQVCPAMLPCLC